MWLLDHLTLLSVPYIILFHTFPENDNVLSALQEFKPLSYFFMNIFTENFTFTMFQSVYYHSYLKGLLNEIMFNTS